MALRDYITNLPTLATTLATGAALATTLGLASPSESYAGRDPCPHSGADIVKENDMTTTVSECPAYVMRLRHEDGANVGVHDVGSFMATNSLLDHLRYTNGRPIRITSSRPDGTTQRITASYKGNDRVGVTYNSSTAELEFTVDGYGEVVSMQFSRLIEYGSVLDKKELKKLNKTLRTNPHHGAVNVENILRSTRIAVEDQCGVPEVLDFNIDIDLE